MTAPARLLLALLSAAALAFAGCGGCAQVPGAQDAGEDPNPPFDAGKPPGKTDAGVKPDAGTRPPDAGVFRTGYVDEPCPDAGYAFEPPDGGFPEGTVVRGLCIALTTLEGNAAIDGAPVKAPFHLTLVGSSFGGEDDVTADGNGDYSVQVLRSRYERVLYHPNEIPNHSGPKDFGAVDLRQNQRRDFSVKTWIVTGAAFFAGQPWPSSTNPPDTTIVTEGILSQSAQDRNLSGTYEVRLIEGQFGYKVSVPLASLGETELTRYPVQQWVDLKEDTTIDIDLPTSELSGNLTIDGEPLPDRLGAAAEYRLDYVLNTESDASVATVHQGGGSFFSAVVPKGQYSVRLELLEAVDPSLPAILYNKQVAKQVDLTQNQQLDIALQTHKLEGALLLDGVPITPKPGYNWTLYAYSITLPTQGWFLSYYVVPLTSSSFNLRALPGEYILYLWLDSNVAPELAEGWYQVANTMPIWKDESLPIDVRTNLFSGKLLIDGVPASNPNGSVGTLYFQSSAGYYRYRVNTTDGTFQVRLPQAEYQVHFEINADAYPDYAVGQHFLGASVDMRSPQTASLQYNTVPVAGPLLVGGEPLPDTLTALPEASLTLQPQGAFGRFTRTLSGGRPWYFLRIPKNNYELTFELKRDGLSGVIPGTAPIGNALILR